MENKLTFSEKLFWMFLIVLLISSMLGCASVRTIGVEGESVTYQESHRMPWNIGDVTVKIADSGSSKTVEVTSEKKSMTNIATIALGALSGYLAAGVQ